MFFSRFFSTTPLLILAALALLAAALPVQAQTAPEAGESATAPAATPLVVIRFSQRNVYFEKALFNAVSKAVEAKGTVVFDIVLKPGLKSISGEANMAKVVKAMRNMGVPQRQLTATSSGSSGEQYDEVHVYVR